MLGLGIVCKKNSKTAFKARITFLDLLIRNFSLSFSFPYPETNFLHFFSVSLKVRLNEQFEED